MTKNNINDLNIFTAFMPVFQYNKIVRVHKKIKFISRGIPFPCASPPPNSSPDNVYNIYYRTYKWRVVKCRCFFVRFYMKLESLLHCSVMFTIHVLKCTWIANYRVVKLTVRHISTVSIRNVRVHYVIYEISDTTINHVIPHK